MGPPLAYVHMWAGLRILESQTSFSLTSRHFDNKTQVRSNMVIWSNNKANKKSAHSHTGRERENHKRPPALP